MQKYKTKKRTEKKLLLTPIKKDAWKWFSKFIRLRDALLTTGTKDMVKCFTCDALVSAWSRGGAQAGHFLDGRGNAVLFDEDLVHAQCLQCNFYRHGFKESYEPKMIALYGKDRVEGFRVQKREIKRYTAEDYEKIRDYYKEEFENMLENN